MYFWRYYVEEYNTAVMCVKMKIFFGEIYLKQFFGT